MRTLRPSGHLTVLPRRGRRGRRALTAALVAALVLSGCGRESDDEVAEPVFEPGQPIEVTGRAGFVFHDVSTSGTLVFPEGSDGDLPVKADEAALQAAANAVREWLDVVLSERNRGLTATVAQSDVDADAFARALGTNGPATDGILDTQVSSANYLIEVAYLGLPGWALARVESILVAADAPTAEIGRRLDSFVFTIDEAGSVEFVALEVAP